MQSIYGLTERMLNVAYTSGYSVKVRGSATLRRGPTPVSLFGTKTNTIHTPVALRYLTEYRCRFTVPSAEQLLSMYTSLNPASIAWEKIPFSFVGDWFYDVGSYLRNLETAYLYSSTFAGGAVTRAMKSRGYYSISGFCTDRTTSTSASGKYAITTHTRSVLTEFPIPRTPSVNLDLSSGRLLNLAALITSFTKG